MPHFFFHIARLQPLFDQLPCREIANGLDQGCMPDIVKCSFEVSVYHPWSGRVGPCDTKDFFNRIVAPSTRAKPIADALKAGFPERFERVFHHGLDAPIFDGGDAISRLHILSSLLQERLQSRILSTPCVATRSHSAIYVGWAICSNTSWSTLTGVF